MCSMYCDKRKRCAGATEKQKLSSLIASLVGSSNRRDNLFSALGIDIQHDFSSHRMTKGGLDSRDFNVNTDSLYGLLGALILDGLRKADNQIKNLLKNGLNNYKIWNCPQLGNNTDEVLGFRMTNGWKLKVTARQQVQETFFDVNMFRIFQVVHEQVEALVCSYLASVIGNEVTDDSFSRDDSSDGDGNDSSDNSGGGDSTDLSHIPNLCLSLAAETFVPQLQNRNQSASIWLFLRACGYQSNHARDWAWRWQHTDLSQGSGLLD